MSAQTPDTHDPRYPIGKFEAPEIITPEDRRYAMASIAEMPELLRDAIRPLTAAQINSPYREGGWTVRQVIHHLGDSHMTAFHRLQRALTEDWPEVHGYNEAAFATLHDVAAPVEWSLQLLEGVHARWVMLLQSFTDDQWQRGFRHSERGKMTLEFATLLYGWHARHHVAHITHLRATKGW
jgi:DinB family protein